MKKRSISPGKWILYLILAVQAAVTTYPLIWMVVSSLKDNVSFLQIRGPYPRILSLSITSRPGKKESRTT